jgi:carotenoid 1,2-hydratase
MTERGRHRAERRADGFVVGPSALARHGDVLSVHIDEVAVPWPRRIRGVVHLHAPRWFDHTVPLDPAGRHRWRALAPCARIEVALERPAPHWQGHAYLDMNEGDTPLEDTFAAWQWSRATLRDGSTAVLYDVEHRGGACEGFGLRFDPSGAVADIAAPAQVALPGTGWRIERRTRADPGGAARVLRTLEDTPFYARSMLEARLLGETVTAVHESLSLLRFRRRLVQWMLPFRMPRRAG